MKAGTLLEFCIVTIVLPKNHISIGDFKETQSRRTRLVTPEQEFQKKNMLLKNRFLLIMWPWFVTSMKNHPSSSQIEKMHSKSTWVTSCVKRYQKSWIYTPKALSLFWKVCRVLCYFCLNCDGYRIIGISAWQLLCLSLNSLEKIFGYYLFRL